MAQLNTFGRRFDFDEEGAVSGEESDVDPLSLGALGVVKPQTRTPAGDYTEYLRKSLASTTPDQPFDAKPYDPETIALLQAQESGRLEEAMKRGHNQKPPVILENVGIEPGATKTRGALSLGGFGSLSAPKPTISTEAVPARKADAATGTTLNGEVAKKAPAMDDGKAEQPVVAMGAGGDEGIDRTALAEALARGGEAIFAGATGQRLSTGIPEMLAAVRQRREAQAQRERELGAEQAREETRASRAEQLEAAKASRLAETERQTNATYAQALKRLYPEEAAARVFDDLEDAAGKPQFAAIARALESRLKGKAERPLIEARAATEKEKPALTQATADLRRAQADRARFLSSPAGIAVARKTAEKEDAALEQARGGRFGGLGLTPAQQESATRAVAENRQQLGAKTAPFAEVITALKNAETAAAGLKEIQPSDVIKAKTPFGLGESLMSNEAKALQKAQQSLTDLILRARSGAAITEGEAQRLTDLYGVKPFRSIADYKKGLKELKSLMYAKLNAAQSGYAATGDVDVDRYAALEDLERGDPNFVSYRDPFFKDVGGTGRRATSAAPAAVAGGADRVRVVGPDGKPGTIPRSQLEAAKKAGFMEAP